MFTQLWNKYLPIIKILMKRSSNGNQTLDLNRTDFERAAGGRKIKFTFTVSIHNGRIQNATNPPPLIKDLVTVLQEDDTSRQLIRKQDFEFSMSSGFQLSIKNNTPSEIVEKEDPAKDEEKN